MTIGRRRRGPAPRTSRGSSGPRAQVVERTTRYRITYATGPDGRRTPRYWREVLVRHEDGSLWRHYMQEAAA